MRDALSRAFFLALARSATLKAAASRYGLRGSRGFARRFVGGETLAEALQVVEALRRRGFAHTLNPLGEHAATQAAARQATEECLHVVDRLGAAGLPCRISVKLSQIGLELDRAACADNLRRILTAARRRDGFVRIDMEGSATVAATLEIFEAAWNDGLRNAGVVLQAYLHRTAADLRRVMALGARVRLCKGAYRAPSDVAWQHRADVDEAFLRLVRVLLAEGHAPAIATHDRRAIDEACRWAGQRGLGPDQFEFQMLFGVRRDLQAAVRDAGYRVRIYVPFGREWFPYFMRRLAERPANAGFVARSLLQERAAARRGAGRGRP